MKTRFAGCMALAAALSAPAVWAATSAPDEARIAEAKAKAAWSDKVTAYQLCEVQDQVAAQYRARLTAAGKALPQRVATPACADPGPFAYTPTQPREGSGAHSPAETATHAPSSVQPDSAGEPSSK